MSHDSRRNPPPSGGGRFKMARIRLSDGELATGFGMIVCYAERFVEVRLGHM